MAAVRQSAPRPRAGAAGGRWHRRAAAAPVALGSARREAELGWAGAAGDGVAPVPARRGAAPPAAAPGPAPGTGDAGLAPGSTPPSLEEHSPAPISPCARSYSQRGGWSELIDLKINFPPKKGAMALRASSGAAW